MSSSARRVNEGVSNLVTATRRGQNRLIIGPGRVHSPARPRLPGDVERVGNNMGRYRTYPRLVGETGGKDFVFAHRSAEVDALAVALVRGAFEYQGQKCSAASRAYIPASIWPELRARVVELVAEIKMGDVTDFRNFMGAVIDEKAFRRLDERLGAARGDSSCKCSPAARPTPRKAGSCSPR